MDSKQMMSNPTDAVTQDGSQQQQRQPQQQHSRSRGFMAGVFSGMVKLSVGHPFDTIKVRMQTAPSSRFSGSWDCLMKTLRNEGPRALFKGASPPLVGWMFMDSIMLGSLSNYRQILLHSGNPLFLSPPTSRTPPESDSITEKADHTLSPFGHGIAGMGAGWTVSFIASPIEHIKARLQTQYHRAGHAVGGSAATVASVKYTGPIDCAQQIIRNHGFLRLWHGLQSTLIFRTFFFFWWSSYDIFSRTLAKRTNMSTPAINFWAGGLSAQVFWITTYPTDIVKQRIMTDNLGSDRKYKYWSDAVRAIHRDFGFRGFFRGFAPTILRAFPANAAALTAFEFAMRNLPEI